ncbi:MAG TPA: hypothetical protein VFQ25_10635 [Ktedonobacterales bacterium]|nr:hypothetical protein [Ktedonobacterales bacterium]
MSERTCLRCGASYEEGATVCFTCGASIGELETPTQPVRTPKGRATADAEAPPGRLSASPAPSATDAAPVATAPEPSAAPRRVVVGSSLPVAPPPAPMPKRRWRWPVIVAALAIMIALLAGGGYALRAVLAGPPLPKTITYRDPNGRFTVTVPALWTATRQASGALLTDSSGANTVTIGDAPAQLGQTAASVADALAAQQGLQPASPTQIGGDTWEQRSGQITGQDGATRTLVVFVDVRAGEVYTIQLSSPTASYTTINNLVYQPLLSSFTFT